MSPHTHTLKQLEKYLMNLRKIISIDTRSNSVVKIPNGPIHTIYQCLLWPTGYHKVQPLEKPSLNS